MKLNSKLDELSIIIPIFNEGRNIEKLWSGIKKNVKLKKLEIIYVDDNSKDNSFDILKKINKKDKKVRFLIRKNKQKDLSKSCVLGFNNSKYSNILVMDGDLQHDPKYLPKMIKLYRKGKFDFIIGVRDLINVRVRSLSLFRQSASFLLIKVFDIFLG